MTNTTAFAPNPTKVTLFISPPTGAFYGSFVLTDGSAPMKPVTRDVTFKGMGSSGQAAGRGLFMLDALPGDPGAEIKTGAVDLGALK